VHTDLPAVLLAINANPNPVEPGDYMMVDLTVTNTRASPVAGLLLKVPLPNVHVDQVACDFITNGNGADAVTYTGGSCSVRDLIQFDLGSLAGGDGTTVTVPMRVSAGGAAPRDGELVRLSARVSAGSVPEAIQMTSIHVIDDPLFDLDLAPDSSPLVAGDPINYTLHYGNRSTTTNAASTTLKMPVPDGLVFDSATEGGQLVNGEVVWGPVDVPPGDYGTVQASFMSPGVIAADIVRARASLADTATNTNRFAATRNVRVTDAMPPLTLSLALDPPVIRSGDGITARLIATNNTGFNRIAQQMELYAKNDNVNTNFMTLRAVTGDDVECTGGSCGTADRVTWNIDALAPGESATRTIVMEPASTVRTGGIYDLTAILRDSGAEVRESTSVSYDAMPVYELALATGQTASSPDDLLDVSVHFGVRWCRSAAADASRATKSCGTSVMCRRATLISAPHTCGQPASAARSSNSKHSYLTMTRARCVRRSTSRSTIRRRLKCPGG
jgi:hypothetical protein